jgi:hypothetical protein
VRLRPAVDPEPLRSTPATPSTPTRAALASAWFEAELARYRDKAKAQHETIPLAGFDTRVRVPIRLDELYVLRERHTHKLFSDHLAFHILQLPHLRASSLSGAPVTRYDAQVTRWARFLAARRDDEREQLASETHIMSLAKDTLHRLSQDSTARRLVREREDAIKLYRDELAVTLAKGQAKGLKRGRKEGRKEGQVEILLELLRARFGRLSAAIRARVEAANPEQLSAWAKRVLTARTLDEVFAR